MNDDLLYKLSPQIWIALIYISNMWVAFVLPLRFLWVVLFIWAAGGAYLWMAHREAVENVVFVLAMLPIVGPLYVVKGIATAGAGLVSGQVLRGLAWSRATKYAGALALSLGLITVSAMSGRYEAERVRAENAALSARQPAEQKFYADTRAEGMRLVSEDPRVIVLTGQSPTVGGGDPSRERNRAGLPATGYIFNASGSRGQVWVRVSIKGSMESPHLAVEKIGHSWKEAAGD